MNKIELIEIQQYIKNEKAILLYFYSDQCAPCVSLRPKVVELVKTAFPKMKVKMIDSVNNQMITAHYGVFANPAILVFFEGNEHSRVSKYVSISQLYASIERPYQMVFN